MTDRTHVFDEELHEANIWVKAIDARLESNDATAKRALRGVLHALRDRIGHANAVHLGAQLPTLVRGMFFEGWRFADAPTTERRRPEFLIHVAEAMGPGLEVDPSHAVRAVFHVLWEKLDPGEGAKLMRLLPADLTKWWPSGPDALDRAARHRARA